MAKRGYILRYQTIINLLRQRPYSSLKVIIEELENRNRDWQLIDDSLVVGVSRRTVQRDFTEIRNLWGIEITYSSSQRGYYIEDTEYNSGLYEEAIDTLNMLSLVSFDKELNKYISFEPRKAKGTHYIADVMNAIKRRVQIEIIYQSYTNSNRPSKRLVQPLGLKEFKGFWYLIANHNGTIKSFGLDRILQLALTDDSFSFPEGFSVKSYYKDCFGIMKPENASVETIIIEAQKLKGEYLNANPLHNSQQIINESTKSTIFSIEVYATYDLRMELLSHGDEIKVIQPEDFFERVM